jgi:GT2 family glycosyltransferase
VTVTPRVSVIVPTHNRPDLLKRAVTSALTQSFSDVEVIVVDDAGEDPTVVLQEFGESRLRLIRHAHNGGLAAARNTGLRVARGEFVTYLDDDDYFLPDHCARLVSLLDRTGAIMAYTDGWATEENWEGPVVTVLRRELVYSRDFDVRQLLCDNILPVNAAMHRRSVFAHTGGFDETLRVHEDWEHWIRVAGSGGTVVHDPTITCEYTTRPGAGNMRTQWHARFLETFQIIHHRYAEASSALGVTMQQSEIRQNCAAWARQQASTMSQEELALAARTGMLRRLAHGAARLGAVPDAPIVRALLEDVAQRVPDEPEAWIGLAAALRFERRPEEALAALCNAVHGGETDALYAELALVCSDLGRSTDAARFTSILVSRTGAPPVPIEPPTARRGAIFTDVRARTPVASA